MLRGRGGVNSEGRPRRTFDGKLGRDVRPHAGQAYLVRVGGGLRLRDVVRVKFALTLVSQTPPGPHVLKCSTTTMRVLQRCSTTYKNGSIYTYIYIPFRRGC